MGNICEGKNSHRLKQSRHNCIIFYYSHTLCVLRPIWNRELQQCKRLYLSGDLSKNFKYSCIAMKVFQGIICHCSVVSTIGVPARSNDRVHLVYFSQYDILLLC